MGYSILLYEDNVQLSESIQVMMRLNENLRVVGSFANPTDVTNHLQKLKPDVVIMDIDMPVMTGIEAVAKVRKVNADIPIIMLTVFDDNQHVFDAICAGATGYLLKKHISTKLFSAIDEVMTGGAPMSPSIARMVLGSVQQKSTTENDYQLTQREREVLGSLSKGNGYKQIAGELNISIDTVRSHIRKIYEKLRVNSQTQAVTKAIHEKLL